MVQVCSIFFLGTLGYKKEHIVSYMFNQQSPTKSNKPDARGRHSPAHKLSEVTKELINKHIESFNPSISHYRRAHAPLRRYLDPGLSVNIMHGNFKEQYADSSVCYETYRLLFRKKNISFTKLGEEECETCEIHKQHVCSNG